MNTKVKCTIKQTVNVDEPFTRLLEYSWLRKPSHAAGNLVSRSFWTFLVTRPVQGCWTAIRRRGGERLEGRGRVSFLG
jgi:hypothetical protein